MMTVTLKMAQENLPDLIERLLPDQPILITHNDIPVARLIAETLASRSPRRAGSAQGLLTIVQEDDEHLQDFAEYLE